MPPSNPIDREERRRRIIEAGSFEALLDQPDGFIILDAEANDPTLDEFERLISPEQLSHLVRVQRQRESSGAKLSLFFSTDDVFVVPGFMGSDLRDVASGGHGLIWIDPGLVIDGLQLNALKLARFRKGIPDQDEDPNARIESRGAIPAIYDVLRATLELIRYHVEICQFDWRKDIHRNATLLADKIRSRLGQPPRPLHVIAHSQGSLVARRAVQMLGAEQSRKLINNLVLLGPASFGTYSAGFALAGNHESLDTARRFRVKIPDGFEGVLRSFTGLYQLLPWNPALVTNGLDPKVRRKFQKEWTPVSEEDRLADGFGFGSDVDTAFFNDRTSIILGDQPTVRDAVLVDGKLVARGNLGQGDGTVPDELAMLPGVRTYRVLEASHMTLPMNLTVIGAIRQLLKGAAPRVDRVAFAQSQLMVSARRTSLSEQDLQYRTTLRRLGLEPPVPLAPMPPTEEDLQAPPRREPGRPRRPARPPTVPIRPEPPEPPCRRLRVFSFDPLLATDLDGLEIAELTLNVPWEQGVALTPGPVGEYVEVVDYDPASRAFYHPLDLSHPRLAAADGLTPSESDPQFHQQMVYAVAMSTIATFEQALGRSALWAPRPSEGPGERAENPNAAPEERYVPRLRIYPHALREPNAYYDPDRHSLLFGYFPSKEQPGGETLPGGTVFTCLSFDIVAHETTHALLHGLHPHFLEPSNPDVLAFHEAFADVVALFQHFSHTEVLRHQLARTRGDFRRGGLLGQLARQFGSALGKRRGALRRYVDTKPDPDLYLKTREPHDRGAILVAAIFRAFVNIFEQRSRDLYRIATGGTGVLPDGDVHPDLVTRLSIEAAKSARHLLTMCIRALDYVPPVDLTFGEYLRALITADYDLVRDDDRGYRVSVIDAFRSWGLYPSAVNVMDQSALLWKAPGAWAREALRDKVREIDLDDWGLKADRRDVFLRMDRNRRNVRTWLFQNARDVPDGRDSLGVLIFGSGYRGIPRNARNAPIFHVRSIRPSRRVGPDGQNTMDLIAEIVQRRAGYFDPALQKTVDDERGAYWAFSEEELALPKRKPLPQRPDFWFQGGCTLIIDPHSGEIRYCVKKSIYTANDSRLDDRRSFRRTAIVPGASDTYFGTRGRNPFAFLHADE
ncbi:MAG: hypothetical protein AB7I30_01005 [Isosphaeraceae bacterium]